MTLDATPVGQDDDTQGISSDRNWRGVMVSVGTEVDLSKTYRFPKDVAGETFSLDFC